MAALLQMQQREAKEMQGSPPAEQHAADHKSLAQASLLPEPAAFATLPLVSAQFTPFMPEAGLLCRCMKLHMHKSCKKSRYRTRPVLGIQTAMISHLSLPPTCSQPPSPRPGVCMPW